MQTDEVSMLSEDLRPRDTPNHTLLKDFDLKPLVPDLSIVEVPQEQPVFHNRCQQPVISQENSHSVVPNRQKPFIEECKTYSEWRKKSASQSKPQPVANPNRDNSCIRYVNENSSPTVLDNLNPLSIRQSCDNPLTTSVNGRPHITNKKDSQVSGTNVKISQSAQRTVSRRSWEAAALPSNSQRQESHCFSGPEGAPQRVNSHFGVGSRKPQLGSANCNNFDHGSRQLVSYQSDVANCISCAHCPHQQISTINCNGTHMFHSYPHKGMPSCNNVPAVPADRIEPCTQSRSVSTNSGSGPAHTFSDSVVYDNLYQIVLSQSEQLKLLQTQVEKLLISQENHSCIGSPRFKGANKNRLSTTAVEKGTQTSDHELERDECTKMSIGVMTTSLTHTVAYAGRVGHVDSRNRVLNQPNRYMAVESRYKEQNDHCQSTSTSPSSQALPTSASCSRSDLQSSPTSGTHKNCCKHPDCMGNEKTNQMIRKSSKPDKVTQMDQLVQDLGDKAPGMSAAIRTVRGCQAALQSQSLPNECDQGRSDLAAGMNESLTLNGAEIPRYSSLVERRVTPPPSLHLVVEEFSDQDGSYSDDESSYSSDSDDTDSQQGIPNGWSSRNNIPLRENNHHESEDSGDRDYLRDRSLGKKKKSRKGRSQKENCPPRSVANIVQKRVSFQQETNSPKENPGDDFKTVALKFLRENYPEELSSGYLPGSKSTVSHKRVNEMAIYGRKNNMSYATFDYLRRYDLLPEADYKTTRIEELPDYGVEIPTTTAELTNGSPSPSKGHYGYVASRFEQHVNSEQYGIGTVNGRDLLSKDHTGRPRLKEKHKPTHFESRKQSSKRRHKKHHPQADFARSSHPNAQQSSPLHNVLDMTALYDQDKLPCNM